VRRLSNRLRLEAVALACPAKRGVGLPSWRVFSESVSESQSGPGSNSLRETDWNTDADSDPDPDRTIRSNGTPERLGLSGSHGQRPWVQLELKLRRNRNIAYSCLTDVPRLRRSVCGPLKPRAHARGYSCAASSRLVWNSSVNTWFYRMGWKPGAKRRQGVAARVSAWFRETNRIEA
jgi:hypothetical protein